MACRLEVISNQNVHIISDVNFDIEIMDLFFWSEVSMVEI